MEETSSLVKKPPERSQHVTGWTWKLNTRVLEPIMPLLKPLRWFQHPMRRERREKGVRLRPPPHPTPPHPPNLR
jgi:hypothetical protein